MTIRRMTIKARMERANNLSPILAMAQVSV